MLTYKVEKWTDTVDDSRWLWPLHYEEASVDKGVVPLEVNEEEFRAMDQIGQMHCVTVRDTETCGECGKCDNSEKGKIVGYCWAVLRPHLHYKSMLCAYFDAYFLHPDYRDGFNGVKLFQVMEETLAKIGVQKMFTFTKLHNHKGPVFEYLGWKPVETTYAKRIGAR